MKIKVEKWVLVKITGGDGSVFHKVFASLSKDIWRLNSGISSVAVDELYFYFFGFSGSVYLCPKNNYGTYSYTSSVLSNLLKKTDSLKILSEKESVKVIEKLMS